MIDPALLTAQINRAPLFESQENWGPGYSKAKGHGPGVVVGPGVDNPNVFAQQFAARPDEAFRIIVRAASVDRPTATGRIQVNWTAPGGKFISASMKLLEVTPEAKTFEHVVQAPAGATSGTLYVVADGNDSVVRYLEMRLLGAASRVAPAPAPAQAASTTAAEPAPSGFPKPPKLTPLDGPGRSLSVVESQYYFYQATKAMQRRARERGMDFIMYVMPDHNIPRLLPAIRQLRAEGVKVLAYEPQSSWASGVDQDWYWHQADSHWTEAAVRLTADEILGMWKNQAVVNRPFSREVMTEYDGGFPEPPAAASR